MNRAGSFVCGGCRLHYDVSGTGPALLFLHGGFGGLGTGTFVPDPQWREEFSAHHTVVTFDRRSSGRSGTSPEPHTLSQFAADARALLDHLDIPRVAVWGHSAGAAIALTTALESADRVAALVVTDAAPWFSQDVDLVRRLRERIALLEREGADAAYAARKTDGAVGLQLFSRPSAAPADPRRTALLAEVQNALRSVTREERVAMYAAELRTYAAYLDFDARPVLDRVAVPIFIAYGTDDGIFPDNDWAQVASAIPSATVRPVEGGNHGCTNRPEIVAAIAQFLAEVS